MATQNIYLKIEPIDDYSPVRPMEKAAPPIEYGRDCMRNKGHEAGVIPEAEIEARTLRAVVYREYRDPNYLVPKLDKLVAADINEPVYNRRIPGTVLYSWPGQHLRIHVLNADRREHSFHIHGLDYGIDSDGAWPLGVRTTGGRRSDSICPGDTWTYVFDVTKEMTGAWPFHDHGPYASASIERGLFGGLIVLEKKPKIVPGIIIDPLPVHILEEENLLREKIARITGRREIRADALPLEARQLHAAYLEWLHEWFMGEIVIVLPPKKDELAHVPIFFHHLSDPEGRPLFDSGELEENGGLFDHVFEQEGSFEYFCQIHPEMEGTIEVTAAAPNVDVTVNIEDAPAMGFYPPIQQVRPNRKVTWINNSQEHHTATSRLGATLPTHCINGRAFIGNTPTIVCDAGAKIRWYLFNLDLGRDWHNFHVHAMRWTFAGETIDVRSLGPAESFVMDTVAPEPFKIDRLPDELAAEIDCIQNPKDRPKKAMKVVLTGDFLFHCHVHHHFMQGMAGVVRSRMELWLTDDLITQIEEVRGLHIEDGLNVCPDVDIDRCKKHGEGEWKDVPGLPGVTMMHAALLPNTNKVLFFGYDSGLPNGNEYSRTWDAGTGVYAPTTNQLSDITPGGLAQWSLWSSEHTFLDSPEGHLLVHGGYRSDLKKAYLFDPATLTWSETDKTAENRFYATTLTLGDGRALTLFGSASKAIEVYTNGTGWAAPMQTPLAMHNHLYYPWTYLLPDGELFIAGPHVPTHRFAWDPPPVSVSGAFSTNKGNRSSGGERGSSVLLTLRPPDYKPQVLIMGGSPLAVRRSVEMIDLSAASPAWTNLPNLNFDRALQFTATLLPDGRVVAAGGISGADGGPVEIFDPRNPAAGWQVGPVMSRPRVYHSSFILLADGSVLSGGDPKTGGLPNEHERYCPGYFFRPRPVITAAPATVNYGANFNVDCPTAGTIAEVIVMRPGAVTHGFNMSQRAVECQIIGGAGTTLTIEAPPNGNVAPPGWYLLFLVDANRVPTLGWWLRITT